MSTLFTIKKDVPVARRFAGKMEWIGDHNLSDETPVFPVDNSAQGIYTVGHIREAIRTGEICPKRNPPEEEVKIILWGIGYYFLEQYTESEKSYDDVMNETYKILSSMNITDCKKIGENHFEVTLCRPGLLIGAKGETIEGLEEKLGVKISIKENTLASMVYPLDLRDY